MRVENEIPRVVKNVRVARRQGSSETPVANSHRADKDERCQERKQFS